MRHRLFTALSLLLIAVPACSDDNNQTPDTGAPREASVGPDAGSKDVGSIKEGLTADLGACVQAAGTYTLTGTCTSSMLSVPSHVCVSQTSDCKVSLSLPNLSLSGTITGDSFSVTGTVSGFAETCTGKVTGNTTTLECSIPAISATCTGSGTKVTLKGATAACCDPVAQDCQSGERCSVVGFGSSASTLLASACLTAAGTKKEGEACVRDSTDVTDIGHDDCEKGLWCTLYGSPSDTQRYCRKLCTAKSQCSASQSCMLVSASAPRAGNCVQTCDPAGDSTDCPTGTACYLITSVDYDPLSTAVDAFCYKAGTKAEGVSCTTAVDCAPGLKCEPTKDGSDAVCTKTCSKKYPCTGTKTCETLTGLTLPTGLDIGVCR